MFKKFFGRDEEEEETFETVDPVLEQRRKEKFSTPLIYNEEEETEEKPVEKVDVKKTEPKKTINTESTYRMSEIISPITGVQKTKKSETKVAKPKVKKIKKETDELIPIISPFYGSASQEDEKEEIQDRQEETIKKVEEPSVEQNLRNIAHIVEEEQDQLKIIEERTGEFKLDLQKEDEDSFIDEIDDSMSLDELMSLYEKKFKD